MVSIKRAKKYYTHPLIISQHYKRKSGKGEIKLRANILLKAKRKNSFCLQLLHNMLQTCLIRNCKKKLGKSSVNQQ
jgi:hypothetical protein